MRQGNYDEADAALTQAARIDPKFWNARFNLAEIPFLRKDWPEARKRFEQLLSSGESDLAKEASQLIQYKILLTYLLEGKEDMVDSIQAKLELSPDTPAVDYVKAAVALKQKNQKEAKDWIGVAEKNFSPQLNKLFAESLYEVGWLEKPAGEARPSLPLMTAAERSEKTKATARAKFEQAQQALRQRDLTAALKLIDEADKADPNQASTINLRGEILAQQEQFDQAEAAFKKAAKLDPKLREAQYNLAQIPFKKKEYAKARDRFETLYKRTPGGDKNQAAELIKFKIYMTLLLEGKESRAHAMMDDFQYTGDTPSLYYAQAAWEFQHNNPEKANDWITSARKIYPLASNDLYAAGFYDLSWLKSAAAISSPAPSAAAIASTQTEPSGPAIEPSPIPGSEVKAEEATQLAMAQTPAPSPAAKASEAVVNATPAEVVVSNAQATGSSAQPGDLPAAPQASGISVESATPNATPAPAPALASFTATPAPEVSVVAAPSAASTPQVVPATPAPEVAVALQPSPSATPVEVTASSATPATALAPEKVARFTPSPSFGERISSFTGQRPLVFWLFILGAIIS